MKTCVLLLASGWLVLFGGAAFAQGTFRNLDFETVNLPDLNPSSPPTSVPLADALPGWTGYIYTNQVCLGMYNGVSLSAAMISIITPFSTSPRGYWGVVGGNYTATLDVGVNGWGIPGPQFLPAAIAQTGFVPVGTRSLRFSLGSLSVVSHLRLSLKGQDIPFFRLSDGSNYQVYGGDVSRFAGLTAELRFTEEVIASPSFARAFLDDIVFSPVPIPEPASGTLFVLGVAACLWPKQKGWRR